MPLRAKSVFLRGGVHAAGIIPNADSADSQLQTAAHFLCAWHATSALFFSADLPPFAIALHHLEARVLCVAAYLANSGCIKTGLGLCEKRGLLVKSSEAS